jgi:hypothetical protein
MDVSVNHKFKSRSEYYFTFGSSIFAYRSMPPCTPESIFFAYTILNRTILTAVMAVCV